MTLLDDLRAEHALIERVVGSLQTWAAARVRGDAEAAEAAEFLRFFRLYAGRYHHAREEDVLVPALVRDTEAPRERGPIAAVLHDHAAMKECLDALEGALGGQPARVAELAARYGEALLHHIDAENSVFFPESEARLARVGAPELPTREPDAEEEAARAAGEKLAERWPPTEPAGIVRGDGCAGCAAFGVRCDGIEREWMDETEWEDLLDRIG